MNHIFLQTIKSFVLFLILLPKQMKLNSFHHKNADIIHLLHIMTFNDVHKSLDVIRMNCTDSKSQAKLYSAHSVYSMIIQKYENYKLWVKQICTSS